MTDQERRLFIPTDVPEDFANAVATVLLLGIAAGTAWDQIYRYNADESLEWIDMILESNDLTGLVHTDINWWESQIRGH